MAGRPRHKPADFLAVLVLQIPGGHPLCRGKPFVYVLLEQYETEFENNCADFQVQWDNFLQSSRWGHVFDIGLFSGRS